MNWQKITEDNLRDYKLKKNSVDQIRQKISFYSTRLYTTGGISYTAVPKEGGSSRYEDQVLDLITKKAELESQYKKLIQHVKWIEKGIEILTEKEKDILYIYYIDPLSGSQKERIESICSKYGVGKTQAYNLKDACLRKFTMAMYGSIED